MKIIHRDGIDRKVRIVVPQGINTVLVGDISQPGYPGNRGNRQIGANESAIRAVFIEFRAHLTHNPKIVAVVGQSDGLGLRWVGLKLVCYGNSQSTSGKSQNQKEGRQAFQ
ncbi:hypothetical protein ES703_36909 [subsurface metagenome]